MSTGRPAAGPAHPAWTRLVFAGTAAYAVIVWVLPTILIVAAGPLPYLRESTYLERLAPWAIATAIFGVLLYLRGRAVGMLAANSAARRNEALALVAALAFAAAAAALLAPTLGGAFVTLVPGADYRSVMSVEAVGTRHHSRYVPYASVDIDVRSQEDQRVRWLEISERVYDAQRLQPGDIVVLRGKQNVFGVYVSAIEPTGSNVRRGFP